MVSPDDLVRIIDFGNSKQIDVKEPNQTHDLEKNSKQFYICVKIELSDKP